MKKVFLKLFALLIVLVMLFSITACKTNTVKNGSGSSNEGFAGTGNNSNGQDIPTLDLGEVETIVDKDGEPYVTPQYNMRDQTVTFLSHWSADIMVYILSYMEKYGGPQVECITQPYSECGTKLQAMVLAENAPDVYKLRMEDKTSLLFSEVWSDITNDFDWDNRNWRDLKPYMQYVTVNGKILAAPEANANYMIWFNKGIFEEYGMENPLDLWEKGEWTKDNFDNICRKLTIREGGNTSIYGFGYDHCWFNEILAMFDTDFVTYNGSKYISNVDDPKLADAFAYINQMSAVEKLWASMDKANAYFASGKQAMLYYGNWLPGTEPYRSMNLEGKIDFVPVPENTATGLGPRQDYSITGHAIPVGAKNREGAKAFIEIFNFYKQSQEQDLETTKKDLEESGLTVEQFFRYRSCRYYENPYTMLSPLNHDEYLIRALNGDTWYVIRESLEPSLNLRLDTISSSNS